MTNIAKKAVILREDTRVSDPDQHQQMSQDEIRRLRQTESFATKINLPQVTFRATVIGLLIGSIVLISNFQFGLQTGWVSMMSLPSALLGYTLFKISPFSDDFTDVENVFVQSVAVAVGTGPLTYGLIGIVPAIEKFLTAEESGVGHTIKFSTTDLFLWCMGLGLFGVFFAIPLRQQVIIKEKLPFPSGSATATLISVMHGTEIYDDFPVTEQSAKATVADDMEAYLDTPASVEVSENASISSDASNYSSNISTLVLTFSISSVYTLVSYFIPQLKSLPIFGTYLSQYYKWNFQPSPAYIGQGIIMGLPTVSYMLFGSIIGWAVLAPYAKYMGWAPGATDDWVNGGQGWILWLSLSVMISDAIISFAIVAFRSVLNAIAFVKRSREREIENAFLLEENSSAKESIEAPLLHIQDKHLISNKATFLGVIFSSILCIISVRMVFGDLVPIYASVVAILLALMFSVLAVRALGETDLNPVSGIGKLSQLIFAVVIPANHPSKILINLIAGGIAEAGAQQAGDLMQDLKTGHLVGASPRAQFIAQIIGTIYSVFLSGIMYKVYNAVYTIPSDQFRIPTAVVWIDCSRLVTGEGLPPYALMFSIIFAVIFGIISLLKNTVPKTSQYHKYLVYLPSGVAVGIGIYNSPNFTLARFVGGVIAYWWLHSKAKSPQKDGKVGMIIFSSGLVLGEGLFSGVAMLLTSLGVPHF